MKESVVREVEDVLTTKIDQLFEGKIAKMNEKIDSRITEVLEAIRLIASNGGGIDRTQSSGMQNAMANPNQGHDDGRNREGNPNLGYSGLTRLSRIDFPRFSGDRVKDWLFKIEQFFLIDRTPEELKVELASIHFDDQAATWHQSLMQSDLGRRLGFEWTSYRHILLERFGEILDDPIAELQNLQETDGILDYHNKFEQLRTRVQLPEEYLVNAYLTGLSTDTQMNVRMFHPKSIRQCLMIGKLYEFAHPKKVFSSGFQGSNRNLGKAKSEEALQGEESSIDPRKFLTNEEDESEVSLQETTLPSLYNFSKEKLSLSNTKESESVDETLKVNSTPLEIMMIDVSTEEDGLVTAELTDPFGFRPDESLLSWIEIGDKVAHKVFDKMPRREMGIFECSCKLKEVESLSMMGDSYGSINFLVFFVFDPGKSNQFKRDWLSDCGRNSMGFLVNVIAHKVFVKMLRKQMAGIHDFVELPIDLRDSYGSVNCCSSFVFDQGKRIEFLFHSEGVETLVILIFDPGGLDCNVYGLRFVRILTLENGLEYAGDKKASQDPVPSSGWHYMLIAELANLGAELAAEFASPICCCIVLLPTDVISSRDPSAEFFMRA